jgi:hypothetical protein
MAETVARNIWHNRKLMFTNHEILNLANWSSLWLWRW